MEQLEGFQDLGFAGLLKLYREGARVSQCRLAQMSGYDHSYVSRLEGEHRTPTRDAVVKFAEALGLVRAEKDNLLASAGFMPTQLESLLADEPVVSNLWRFLQERDISQEIREQVIDQVDGLVRLARLATRDTVPNDELVAD